MRRFRLVRRAASVVAVSLLAATAMAADMVLVEKGVSLAPIVVAEGATPATEKAAVELADYIEKISGARPELLAGPPDPVPEHAIWIGLQPVLSDRIPELTLEFTHPEEILLVCNGRHALMAGRDRWAGTNQVEFGTANAVYTFIEKQLDVRWLWPGELGEDILPRDTITIPAFEHRFHPPLRMRNIRTGSKGWRYDPLIIAWFRHQRGELDSAQFSGGHSFTDWWENYHEDHPEWFALRGKAGRTPEKWGPTPNPHAVKLCVSNPEVVEQWLRNAEETLRQDPAHTMFSGTPNDGGGFCTCTNCRAWDHPDGPPVWGYVALTDRYVKFWNLLARGLRERFPGRELYLGAAAYSSYRTPPVAEELEPNIAISYVGCFPLETEANRAAQKADWKRWSQSATMMWYRPNLWYWAGGIWALPDVTMKKMAEDFRFLAANHCVGLEVDGMRGYWATQGPAYYLLAKLSYDPFLDAEAVMKDYYRRGFGPAAEELEAYWTMMEDARDRLVELPEFKTGSAARYGLPPLFEKIYSSDFLAQAEALLSQAAAKTADESGVYGQRVAFVRHGFDYTRLLVETIPLMTRARESKGKDTAAVQAAVDNWAAIEETVNEAGVIGLTYYAYITRAIGGSGYMGVMQDHLGPPSEALRKAAYDGPREVEEALGRE